MKKLLGLGFVFVAFAVQGAERIPGHAAIASAHELATRAGEEILRQGGNAFDAAVAVAAALAVVEPNGSGLGGGGFLLLHRASDGLDTVIDARERAPQAATRDMFLDREGNPIPKLSTDSALAAAIPGEPAAMAYLARKFGRLPLRISLQPAIALARKGFVVNPRLLERIRGKLEAFRKSRDTARIFLKNGDVPPPGFIIRQPELARTLEMIAQKDVGTFYRGSFARNLSARVRELHGIWTERDLAEYRIVERKPVIGTYRGARVVSAPPPSSGGTTLVDALNILEPYDLAAVNSTLRKHLIVEALRRAYRDRAIYLGDPDFVPVPVDQLTSKFYADGQRTSLRMDRATPSEDLPSDALAAHQGPSTTHFSVLDRDGNRVAATLTINLWFGSGIMVPGTGILLNNEMDDFSIKAGAPNSYRLIGAEANAIAPGKRPLSSMTPTFVETPGGVMLAGSPDGSLIISMLVLASLDFVEGKSAMEIVSAPRIHHQYFPDALRFEPDALTVAQQSALAAMGHKLEPTKRWGNEQVIVWDYNSGRVEAASDPRGVGAGVVD